MTAIATPSTRTRLAERTYLPDAKHAHKIDREAGVIKGVRVVGFESMNRRRYPRDILQTALAKYEGADVNLDHELVPEERSIVDGWGVLRGANLQEDGVYADLHYLKSHAATPMLLEMAERFPRNFGMSHVAIGTFHRDAEGWDVVDEIQAIESVDVVRKPATNAGLFESRGRKSRRKLRDLLKGMESNAGATGLGKLLEEEGFAPFGDLPIETADPAELATQPDEAEQALAAGLEAIVIAILKQDLSATEKADRIKQILTAGDTPTNGDGPEPGEDSEGDDGMTTPTPKTKETPPAPAPATDELKKQVEGLTRQLALTQLYDDAGIRPSQLTEAQRKLVEAQTTENAKALIETLKGTLAPTEPAPAPTTRPVVNRAVAPAAPVGAAKYEDVLAEAKSSTAGRGQRLTRQTV